jgi:hypothetical protein
MIWLTTPTRGRVALWIVLAGLWFLFLPQQLAMAGGSKVSVPGALFWAVVLVWLIGCALITSRRYRRVRQEGPVR